MTNTDDAPCTEGGKRHRVPEAALLEARANAREDGSFDVRCLDCGKIIKKGPTDLTFRGTVA